MEANLRQGAEEADVEIEGYNLVWDEGREIMSKQNSRVALYIKDELSYEVVKKHMEGSNFNHFILKPVLYDARFRNEIHIPSDPAKMEAFLESRHISSAFPYVLQNRLTQPEYSSCTLVSLLLTITDSCPRWLEARL